MQHVVWFMQICLIFCLDSALVWQVLACWLCTQVIDLPKEVLAASARGIPGLWGSHPCSDCPNGGVSLILWWGHCFNYPQQTTVTIQNGSQCCCCPIEVSDWSN